MIYIQGEGGADAPSDSLHITGTRSVVIYGRVRHRNPGASHSSPAGRKSMNFKKCFSDL